MKAAWKRSVAVFFLWSALAGLAAAQRADDQREWEAWKGTPAPWKNAAEAERTVAEYRAWLAVLRVKLMTGRTAELPGWEERLELIRLHATSAVPLPAQRELLVEVARARAQALSTQGRFAEARAAAEAVLFAPDDPSAAAQEGQRVSAPPALLALAESALADPALEEVRMDLSPTAAADSAQDEGLDERLRQAIAAGDFELVAQVGARAAPALEEELALDLAQLPADDIANDAFYLLSDISERRAAAFALAHIDAGYAFRLRVVRTMQRREVFGGKPLPSDSVGVVQQRRPPSALAAEWSLVVARLLRHGDSAGNALQLVEAMIQADLLCAEVTSALAAALRSPQGKELSAELLQHLTAVPSAKTALGLFELLVAHEDHLLRRLAAQRLLSLGAVPPLLERANDPDPVVRELVGQAIRGEGKKLAPSIDDRAVAALRSLLADPSVDVRRAAAGTLVALPRPLEPELYRAVARDPDPVVRSNLAWLSHPDDGLVRDVLLALARETDPQVRQEVDDRLQDDDSWTRPQTALPAAELRLLDPTWTADRRGNLIWRLVSMDEGLRLLFACAAAQPRSSLVSGIFDRIAHMDSSTGRGTQALLVLNDESLALSYVLMHGASQINFRDLNQRIAQANPPRWAAMLRVLEDSAAPAEVRLAAAARASPGGGERFRAALLALFASEPLHSRQLSADESEALVEVLGTLPGEELNPLALAALQNDGLDDRVRARIAGSYSSRGPLARELTLGILKRWLDAEDGRAAAAVGTALQHLRSLPEDLDPVLLTQALRKPWYSESAVAAMSALQDPVYLPALESALSPDWVYNDGSRYYSIQSGAVRGLTSFPGDEATEILLRGAATGDASVRNLCMGALAARREVEEQRKLWAGSKEARLDRADAVQKLLGQLRDADAAIRGQAARALATLGALETLPALIELLKDGDPGVRKAAGEALERLNALPAREG